LRLLTDYTHTGFCNTFLIGPDGPGDAILIDPGVFDSHLLMLIEENELYLRYILLTHAHKGHLGGITTIRKIYDTTIYYYGHSVNDIQTVRIHEGESIRIGEFDIEVLETPGHSGDSVIFLLDRYLFTGDTLMAGKIGNTPDAFSKGLLLSSIREKILTLDDEYMIFPGHGPPTKVGIERKLNPDLLEEVKSDTTS
jgi:glyoxylase-like metal-dependent hydrolase (beta-lactamase superfamily II)